MAWFANFYEPMIRPLEAAVFRKISKEIAGRAEGHVLEVGSGTGLDFAHYIHATHVAAIEPDEEMAKQSLGKIREAPVPITLYAASAEALPFPDHSFDAVVATLVFCTIPDPKLAFQELGRTAALFIRACGNAGPPDGQPAADDDARLVESGRRLPPGSQVRCHG